MKFLDEIGLAYFWEKIKSWVGKNYLSLTGGTLTGSFYVNSKDGAVAIESNFISLAKIVNGPRETIRLDGSTGYISCQELTTPKVVKTDGTATQVLMADGSVKTLNANNGIAGLDSNGYVPLSQLGNLDTTIAEVVTALPTTNIKKHIYLIKDTDGVTQNKYEEYIYTGDTSATYDASKWEKLGDFRATVDLADYAKKSETISNIEILERTIQGPALRGIYLHITRSDSNTFNIDLPAVTKTTMGVMLPADKLKLDGIATNANNYTLPLAANGTRGGIQVGYVANGRNYPVLLSGEKAYVNVPWTDTNTTYDLSPYAKTADVNVALSKKVDVVSGKGLSTHDFTSAYKSKLDGISSGATADSAITTAEIDALFA